MRTPRIDQIGQPRFQLELRDQKRETMGRPTLTPGASIKAAQNSSQYYDPNDACTAMTAARARYALNTRRFRFRPLVAADLQRLTLLGQDHRMAATTVGVPCPDTIEFARSWMSTGPLRSLHWAVFRVCDDRIVGYAGLHNVDLHRSQAELRFWVGYGVEQSRDAVEWASAILNFASGNLVLHRLYALQLDRHPIASLALSSIGMRREGFIRKRLFRGGQMEGVVAWAIYGVTKGC